MEQKLIQKLKVEKAIDIRIEELKRQLRKITHDYHRRVYFILKEIIELRKKQIKGYGISHLSKEKGINLTSHQIAYIFGYRFISSFVMDKIDKGELKVSTALFIIKQDQRFREPTPQNKAVKMYLEGKLKTTEISRLSSDIIFNKVNYKKEIKKANKQLINMGFGLQEYIKILRCKKKLFIDTKSLKIIQKESKALKELTQELQRIIIHSGKINELSTEILEESK